MKTKKTQALIRVALILGILVVLNFISVRLFSRLDLTEGGVYTLSDASRALVGSLDDRVTVKAFFTEDLPAPYNGYRRSVLDILNEYKAYAKGNLAFEFINPQGEKGEQNAREQGIAPAQVNVFKEDKLEVARAYFGLVFLFEDRKEVIPAVQNLSSLEYDISSTLKKLTTVTKKRIGYTTGHQETAMTDLRQVNQMVSEQYNLVPVDLSSSSPVPSDISALLIIAPQTKFSDSSKYAIDQYVMGGGKVAFFINKMNANLQQRFAQPLDVGLDDLLENFGVRVNGDLVRDAQCANIQVVQQQGPFQFASQIRFPYMPISSEFDKSNAMVKDLEGITFFFVSSLDTSLASIKGVKASVLARSSKQSGRQAGFMMIDPTHRYTAAEFGESGIPMAALVEGSFKTLFEGKQPAPNLTQSPSTRIIVVGDGDFMKDELRSRDNFAFFANIVDYLADDAGLITIRSKNVAQPPLEQISDGTRQLLKYANLILPPLLVAGYGVFRWRRRVTLKKSLEAQL
ncbi:MAG: Gldg family protein [Ignavibacteriales bacterium]|nr:Gldg family protein [Ignavibacteriales bacterium]